MFLLSVKTNHAQSGIPIVDWWVFANAGAQSSGGNISLSGTLGQPVIDYAAGGTDQLHAGFWQDAAAPATIADLRISKPDSKAHLDWTPVGQNILSQPIAGVTYRVYRVQDRPYIFTANDLYARGIPVPLYSDPDLTVITDTVHSTYYRVTALDGNGQESLSSNTVGVFAYLLTPGN